MYMKIQRPIKQVWYLLHHPTVTWTPFQVGWDYGDRLELCFGWFYFHNSCFFTPVQGILNFKINICKWLPSSLQACLKVVKCVRQTCLKSLLRPRHYSIHSVKLEKSFSCSGLWKINLLKQPCIVAGIYSSKTCIHLQLVLKLKVLFWALYPLIVFFFFPNFVFLIQCIVLICLLK